MKRFVFLLLLIPMSAFAQNKPECDVNSIKPKWYSATDFYEKYGASLQNKQMIAGYNAAEMKPHLQAALKWVQGKANGISGAKEARYYNNFFTGNPDPESLYSDPWYHATGRLGYFYLRVVSQQLYCTSDGRMVELSGPAFIDVSFNNFHHFADAVYKNDENDISIPYLIDGKPVYKIPEIKRSEGRVDYYEFPGPVPEYVFNYDKWVFYNAYIIRNSEKPLFIPVTRREYLEQYLKDMEIFYKKQIELVLQYTVVSPPEEFDRELNERIAEIKKLTAEGAWGYTKENMEQRIKTAEEFYRNKKAEEVNKVKTLTEQVDNDYAESVQMIKDYLQKQSPGVLVKPVRDVITVGNYDPATVREMLKYFYDLGGERTWGKNTRVCFINKDYFNNSLPPDEPQFIAVEFANLENVHKNLNGIVANINKDFDFSGLKVLLSGNKNMGPAAQPAILAKAGGNKFLPKSDQLPKLPFALAPVNNQAGVNVFGQMQSPGFNKAPVQIKFPPPSPLLQNIPSLLTAADYKKYVAGLQQSVKNAMPAKNINYLDEFCTLNKVTTSEDLARNGIGAWLSGNPSAALYFHAKAVVGNINDGLSANNFAAYLLKSGYPEKALPIFQYWLAKYPENTLLLSNAANSYYFLGDFDKSIQMAKQCVAIDSLHPGANKLLAFGYYKSGEKLLCKGALERSLKSSYDEEVISMLLELDPKSKISKLLYEGRKNVVEPMLLKRFQLPEAISGIEEAELQRNTILEVRESLNSTIEAIGNKRPVVDLDALAQKNFELMMKSRSLPLIQIIAQAIVFESAQEYHKEFAEEQQYFGQQLKSKSKDYYTLTGAIVKRYNEQMSKYEAGEDEDPELQRLEKAKCMELNKAMNDYLQATAPLVNQFAGRLEYISRRHHSTIANWMPQWLQSDEAADFPGTQISYLQSMKNILDMYPLNTPTDCSYLNLNTNDTIKGKLMIWEEKFCPVKFSVGFGFGKVGVQCNTFSLSGGEVLQGEWEVKLNDEWNAVEETTIAAGAGASWTLGDSDIAGIEAGVSSKLYVKWGKNKATGEWELMDVGNKSDATVTGKIGSADVEVKLAEVSIGIRSGISSDGLINKLPVMK